MQVPNSGQNQPINTPLMLKGSTVEPQFNDLRYNNIPGITINNHLPSKSYSKTYGAEPRYNDLPSL